jgi:glycosyltransferase involved in cell wall biosynthesis
MSEPVVSVVFRAFNCQNYIGQAIDSILAQTFQDFEVVIVNDASTDGTGRILQTYAQQDERIRVFISEANQGPVRTMNRGLRHARGQFIAVHDADDLSLPHRLETQVDFLRTNPHIALIGGGAYVIDEDGEEFKVNTWPRKEAEQARQHLEQGYSFTHSSLMYRRECIEAIGLYDEFFLSSHDYDVLIRMADAFDIVYYEEPLVKWRCLSTGVTGTKKQAQAAFAELARARSKAKREGTFLDLRQEFDRLMSRPETSDDIVHGNRPLTGALYYYNIGVMLLDRGKQRKARKRFWQALQHKGNLNIYLRALVFYLFSFWPNSVNSGLVRVLRKAF